jgi:hypothetical protein
MVTRRGRLRGADAPKQGKKGVFLRAKSRILAIFARFSPFWASCPLQFPFECV